MDLDYLVTEHEPASDAAAQLFELQVAQFRHDEIYHREITRLTVHARINHMALHFCKYVGQLAEAVLVSDESTIQRTIVDGFIINTCAANTLNIRLADFVLGAEAECGSLTAFTDDLVCSTPPKERNGQWLVTAYATDAGKIARACEKIDHLEAFSFRENIAASVGSIGRLSLVAARTQGFILISEVHKRLFDVEKRYIFHNICK